MAGEASRRFSREFKLAALRRMLAGENVSALARELGIRRKYLYQWRERFRAGGPLVVRSHGRPTKAAVLAMQAPEELAAAAAVAPAETDERSKVQRRSAELERKVGQQQIELDFFGEPCGKSGKRARGAARLADNPLYTKRFAHYVGRRCREATIKDIATELKLDWDTVKTLEKQDMHAQLARAGTPGPKAIGIDEISIRKGHSYRIVVSDLTRRRPIWFGGADRSEASVVQFYDWLGQKKNRCIRLVVMDMWKPFRTVARERASQAAILFDKFHIMRHLGKALDHVRKAEYAWLSGKDRRFIKGQKYTLLARHENLSLEGKRALKLLLAANKRLNTAYVLKGSFGQLRNYEREGWARGFFENWRASLKWQRLEPYEKFAEMIDRHWDGIAAYCQPENKVSLGFAKGLNNKIRVLRRRAYDLRDQEYLRLKLLTWRLPAL